MPMRRRARIGAAVLAAATLCACGSAGPSAPPAPGPTVGQQADAALPASVLQTPLVSTSRQRFDLAQLGGKVVVISDMMTLCQETCPLDTADVVAAARDVERAGLGSRVVFLSLTIDPQRDTVDRLAAYRKLYAPAPADWMLATESPQNAASFWRALGVYIQRTPDKPPAPRDWLTGKPLTYDLTHSDEVFFLDGTSHERFVLEGSPHVAAGASVPARLLRFLDARGRSNLEHPQAAAWTVPQELQVLSWLTGHRIGDSGG